MGHFLFANRYSGRYAARRIRTVADSLAAAGITTTLYTVRTPDDVRACCTAMYDSDDHPTVLVAAGDGTINAVLNCLIPGSAVLGVVPLGTSNVLAAELGIRSVADSVQKIIRGTSRPMTTGRLDLFNLRYRFALMAGIGLDGAVVRDVCDTEKSLLRQGAYLRSALKNSFNWEKDTLEVVTATESVTCHTAVVCNASRYGGNFVLAPECDLFSPGLVIACIQSTGRSAYLGAALDLVRGRAGSSCRIHRIACQEAEIRGYRPIQIDGDFVGYSPAKLSAVHDVCRIIV